MVEIDQQEFYKKMTEDIMSEYIDSEVKTTMEEDLKKQEEKNYEHSIEVDTHIKVKENTERKFAVNPEDSTAEEEYMMEEGNDYEEETTIEDNTMAESANIEIDYKNEESVMEGIVKEENLEKLYSVIFDKENLPSYKCNTCGEKYIKKYIIKKHVRKHTGLQEKFKCEECGEEFNRKACKNQHQARVHDKLTRYSCFVCEKRFFDRHSMLNHIVVHDEARAKCKERYLPEELAKTMKLEGKVVFEGKEVTEKTVCSFCNKLVSTWQNKKKHESRNHGDGNETQMKAKKEVKSSPDEFIKVEKETAIPCVLDCSKTFSQKADFDRHMEIGDHDGAFFFSCKKCPKKFDSTKAMKTHICDLTVKHNPVKTEVTEKKMTKINKAEAKQVEKTPASEHQVKTVVSSRKSEAKNTYEPKSRPQTDQNKHVDVQTKTAEDELHDPSLECKECGNKLPSSESLSIHIRIHKEQNVHACRAKDCGATFSAHQDLWDHKLASHGEKKLNYSKTRVTCEVCDKSFEHNYMKYHMLKHSSEKNVVCQECGKRFKRADSLKPHMDFHKGVKNWNCDECGLKFYSQPGLTNHKRFKHSSVDQSKICHLCSKVCHSNGYLTRHMEIHTGERKYPCGQEGCDKRFRSGQTRDFHVKVHKGIREYQCTMCAKQFTQKAQLTVHVKRHQGIREHECLTCGRGFVEPAGARHCKHSTRPPPGKHGIQGLTCGPEEVKL